MYLLEMNQSFIPIALNLTMPPWLPKETLAKYRQVWLWLGIPGQTQPKVAVSDATISS